MGIPNGRSPWEFPREEFFMGIPYGHGPPTGVWGAEPLGIAGGAGGALAPRHQGHYCSSRVYMPFSALVLLVGLLSS